jgi:translation initiation factor 6
MGTAKATIGNNDYIGAFGLATDSFILVSSRATKSERSILEDNLMVKVHGMSVDGSGLIGVYIVANSNGILVPEMIDSRELHALRYAFPNIRVDVISTSLNALRNNILSNDKVAFINHQYSPAESKKIEDALGVEVIRRQIGSFDTVGANNILTNKGAVLNNSATDDDIEFVKSRIGCISQSTANTGSSSIGLCAISNSKGVVVGGKTTGFELVRISEGLDL